MKIYLTVILLGILVVTAFVNADVISSERMIDWGLAGVEGGIPSSSWNQCGSTIIAGASAATINDAIQNCPAEHYVQLGAGNFNLDAGLVMKSGVVLRGMGADQTFLNFTDVDPCAGGWSAICFLGGDSSSWSGSELTQPGGSLAADWAAGYSKGTDQITLSNIGSSGISVGQYLYLDQNNDIATSNGLFTCENTGADPPCSVEGGSGNPGRVIGGVARQQIQIVRVTGMNGNDISITPGLYAPNWSGGKSPGAWWSPEMVKNSGLEYISVDTTNAGGLGSISMFNAANVWVKGTRQIRSCNCNRFIIQMGQTAHVTIEDNYFFGTSGHSQNYGVETYIASDILVVNNIFQHVVSPMMLHSNQGSVYAYNYAINDPYGDGGLPQYHWMAAMFGGHSGGVMYNLFEGNIGPGLGADYIHGNQTMNTIFRNYFLGSDPGRIDNTFALRIDAWNRYWNVVGNVLSTPGYTTSYSSGDNPGIYALGFGYDTLPADPLVASTMLRWGNYDTVGGTTRWDISEVPSGLGQYANPVPSDHNLPDSLFFPTRPEWWPSQETWPPIGPDVTDGDIINLAGHVDATPAKNCYSNVMSGPLDGSGSALGFNASDCYNESGDTTAPGSPIGLAVW